MPKRGVEDGILNSRRFFMLRVWFIFIILGISLSAAIEGPVAVSPELLPGDPAATVHKNNQMDKADNDQIDWVWMNIPLVPGEGTPEIDQPASLDNPDACSFNHKWNDAEKCDWATRCSPHTSHISYNVISFCWLKSSLWSTVVLGLWTVFLFWLSGILSDMFLTPPMVHLASLLKLSEALAGCTLLAIANSANDTLSGAIAAYSSPKQLGIFMGDALGGTLFLVSLVYGAAILSSTSSPLKLSKRTQIRDACFLLFNLSALFSVPFLPTSAWWIPPLLILSFIAYVSVAIHFDKAGRLNQNDDRESCHESTEKTPLINIGRDTHAQQYSQEAQLPTTNPHSSPDHCITQCRRNTTSADIRRNSRNTLSLAFETRAGRRLISKIFVEPVDKQERHLEMLSNFPAESLSTLAAEVNEQMLPANYFLSLLSMLSNVLLAPVLFIWKSTIPVINKSPPSHWRTALFFVSIPLCLCANSWRTIQPFVFGAAIFTGVCAGIVYIVLSLIRPKVLPIHAIDKEAKWYHSSMTRTCVAAFMVSWALFWSTVISGEIIQCIATLGTLRGVSNEVLGLTVMAWGNNIGDLFADVAISKAGHAEMGLAGAYGACIVTMSFGVPIIASIHIFRQLVDRVELTVVPFALDVPLIFTGVALLCTIVTWLGYIVFKDFLVPRRSGFYLVSGFVIVNICFISYVLFYPTNS